MSEDIRALTAQLASDPTSLVFLRLGEALLDTGRLDAAAKVVRQGLSRHPNLPDGHDLYARILVEQEDFESAFDEWDITVRLDPQYGGAHKGLGYLYYQAGELAAAQHHLEAAAELRPDDASLRMALERVRSRLAERQQATGASVIDVPAAAAAPPEPVVEVEPAVPAAVGAEPPPAPRGSGPLAAGEEDTLLVDSAGLRLDGALAGAGLEADDRVAAELAGVGREAARTARLLNLGEWQTIAVEAAAANFVIVAPTPESLLLVRRPPTVPMGRVALAAMRSKDGARQWLRQGGAE
ncbi:MAG: tetratricopeptide repeat protein [Gemmatimonadales bacterium]